MVSKSVTNHLSLSCYARKNSWYVESKSSSVYIRHHSRNLHYWSNAWWSSFDVYTSLGECRALRLEKKPQKANISKCHLRFCITFKKSCLQRSLEVEASWYGMISLPLMVPAESKLSKGKWIYQIPPLMLCSSYVPLILITLVEMWVDFSGQWSDWKGDSQLVP